MGTGPEPQDALPVTATCPTDSGINGSNGGERALFHSFSAIRQEGCCRPAAHRREDLTRSGRSTWSAKSMS